MRSLTLFALLGVSVSPSLAAERPNILWIVFEDISPDIGAYGDKYAATPHLDRLARESVRYTRAFSNGGACAPARSTLITGVYPPSIGTHHMRSRGVPPAHIRGFTEWLREAGYYTSNHAKTDYNWEPPQSTWDVIGSDWREDGWRKRGEKPFFTVVNITDTHSSQIYHPWYGWPARRAALAESQRHDPDRAEVPPYYPDTPEARGAFARYADNISFADGIVGDVLDQLENDGLADDTIVFYYSDHGRGMPRSKSFLFESSTHVPLLIRFPEKFQALAPAEPGGVVERMAAFVDFAPTVLSLAGIEPPRHFHGRAFLGKYAGEAAQYVFGYRDRMDERYEFIRSVRGRRFKYIRNYFPHLPWFHKQTRLYPSTHPVAASWHRLARAGELTGAARIYMAATKPREQLFDLENDPHELRNLAGDPQYEDKLKELRGAHREWVVAKRDLGFLPESDMWLRFGGAAAAAAAADRQAYPIERILETADWVGGGSEFVGRQQDRLADDDPTVRFWAALGLLAAGGRARPAATDLRARLYDDSAAVSTVAAQALCALGECAAALPLLLEQVKNADEWTALRAANAIHQLGGKAAPLHAELRAMHAAAAKLEARDFFREAPYVQWVLRALFRDAQAN